MVVRFDNYYADAENYQYPQDVQRIMKVAFVHGVILTAYEASQAWSEHSDDYAAGWLFLPESDEDLWNQLPDWARGEQ